MKNKKITIAVLLLAVVAFLFTSCNQGFKMNAEQEAVYNEFIDNIIQSIQDSDMQAEYVKTEVDSINKKASSTGFEIVDTTPNTDIKQGTSKPDLEKRFIAKKK